jgi:hypothetical protein
VIDLKAELPYNPRFIPPIIADLERLACGDPTVVQECRNAGRDPEDQFEILLCICFRMLGYDVEELGHTTKRRDPDGIAFARYDHYAVLFEAKIRSDGYSIGTDDRTIIEYIDTQSPRLVHEGIDSIYYSIVSSRFTGDNPTRIMKIRKETNVKNVTLLRAAFLLRLVELKLRDPRQTTGRLEGLFLRAQEISAEDIEQELC